MPKMPTPVEHFQSRDMATLKTRLDKAEHVAGVQTTVIENMQEQITLLHGMVLELNPGLRPDGLVLPTKPKLVVP